MVFLMQFYFLQLKKKETFNYDRLLDIPGREWLFCFNLKVIITDISFFLQCFEVRGVKDFRVKIVLDSFLSALEISTESADPNLILERTLQGVAEHEEVYL